MPDWQGESSVASRAAVGYHRTDAAGPFRRAARDHSGNLQAVSEIPPTSDTQSKPAPRRYLLCVLGLTMVVFGRCVMHDFITWDDYDMVSRHAILNPVTWDTLRQVWTGPTIGLYTPLAYTVWAGVAIIARLSVADAAGATLNPMAFHLLNVLLHAACAAMIFGILLQLKCRPPAAAIGAAVFAVHPLQVEAVAWVSGMNNLLAGAFAMGCIWGYLRWTQSGRGGWYALAALSLLLALLSKPTATVTPLMLLVIDAMLLRRPIRRVLLSILPLVVLTVPFVIVGRVVQPAEFAFVPPVVQRLIVAGDALGFYVLKLVWPWPLLMEYSRSPQWLLGGGATAGTFLCLAAIAALVAWRGWRRDLVVIAAVAVFVAGVIPVLGLVPFNFQAYSTVADRYVYMAMLGVAIAVAMLLGRGRRVALGMVGAVLVLLAGVSFVQADKWQNTVTIAGHTLAHNSRSTAAHVALGQSYRQAGDNAAAERHYLATLAIEPGNVFANVNLANLYREQGRAGEAITHYQAAYEQKHVNAAMYQNFATLLLQSGQPQRAADLLADVVPAHDDDRQLRFLRAIALMDLRRFDQAEAELRELLRTNPDDASARRGLAAAEAARAGRPTP